MMVDRRRTMDERQETCDESRLIPLTQGKFAIVDAADYERLAGHKWCLGGNNNGQYYANRWNHGKIVKMHHEIIDVPEGMVCDHINHNSLDNRRCNLRVCTPSQNAQNRLPSDGGTSRYKGVCWNKEKRKWVAEICYKNQRIYIGCYDYEEDAAIAYDDMAIQLFGEFACLNCTCRPEIKQWIQDCYLFEPTVAEIGYGK
ncbi:MAG: HNH endonuclease [Sedimentisphaerales bacterium]|nr:HNH endonuclease [Sedimentisphaerales bacterium]